MPKSSRRKSRFGFRSVEAAKKRQWGGHTERLMVAMASSYVVSPAALRSIGSDPAHSNDCLSASYLIGLAARIVRAVGDLWRSAWQKDRR
jgi:hypothetical protein